MGTSMSKTESFSVLTTDESMSYEDESEETTVCSAFWVRKKEHPLKLLGADDSTTVTTRRSFSSACGTSSFLSSNNSTTSSQDDDDASHHSESYFDSCGGGVVSNLPNSTSWSSSLDAESSWYSPYYTQEELDMVDGDLPTPESDLRPSPTHSRTFHVVTTASLPWMTGTAVNALLRAAYLSQLNRGAAAACALEGDEEEEATSNKPLPRSTVTLVIPWLESAEDRIHLYGPDWEHKTKSDQDVYIRDWLKNKANLLLESDVASGGIQIQFYNARFHKGMNSIFAMGDICSSISGEEADVCILEEPEHLNWYRAPGKDWWTEKFQHVVGIGHTNYKAYVREQFYFMSPVVGVLSSWMVRAYCHKLIKLSSVLQTYAPEKEVVCNVHGIRKDFLEIGRQVTPRQLQGIYFIGKLLWAKGFDRMIELQVHYRNVTGHYFDLDIVGSGPDQSEIERAFYGKGQPSPKKSSKKSGGFESPQQQQQPQQPYELRIPKSRYEFRREAIPVEFRGRHDHAEFCQNYKIFVNPSLTEVLCTTTAEAIAMNKFVLVPAHPSNLFFRQFPNCLQYRNKTEFVKLLQYALTHDPEPLSEELQYALTWEAATERCLEAAAISRRDAKRRERVGKAEADAKIAKLHYQIGKGVKGDVIRKVLGGGPVSDQVQYEKQTSSLQQEQQEQQQVAAAC